MFLKNQKTAFTLIELLVVIVIISILATIAIASYSQNIRKARRANTQTEMAQILRSIRMLEIDTGLTIGGQAFGTCTQNPEVILSEANCGGGLFCETGTGTAGLNFDYTGTNWNGPYLAGDILEDPWGNPYRFDFDFYCSSTQFLDRECDGRNVISAVQSAGPDGLFTYTDDQIVPFCIP